MAVGVLSVSRLACGAYGDQSEDTRGQVEDRVRRLAQNAQAAGEQADHQLAQHKGHADENGAERDALWMAPERPHLPTLVGRHSGSAQRVI